MNQCTQMVIRFSIEMKIESKNCNILKELNWKEEFNTNVLLFIFLLKL